MPQRTPDGLVIKGTIKEPVWWDYSITMTDTDLIDILKVAVSRETIDYLQTVDRPWRVLGTLATAMVQFAILWVRARLVVYWRKLSRQGIVESEEKAA